MTDIVTEKWNNFNRNVQNYIIDQIEDMRLKVDYGIYWGGKPNKIDITSPYSSYVRDNIFDEIMNPQLAYSNGLFERFCHYGDSETYDSVFVNVNIYPPLTVRDVNGNFDSLYLTNYNTYNELFLYEDSEEDLEEYFTDSIKTTVIVKSKIAGTINIDTPFNNIREIHADDIIFALENKGFIMDESEQNKIHEWLFNCLNDFYDKYVHINQVFDNEYVPYFRDMNLVYSTLPEAFDYSNPDITIDLNTLELIGIAFEW